MWCFGIQFCQVQYYLLRIMKRTYLLLDMVQSTHINSLIFLATNSNSSFTSYFFVCFSLVRKVFGHAFPIQKRTKLLRSHGKVCSTNGLLKEKYIVTREKPTSIGFSIGLIPYVDVVLMSKLKDSKFTLQILD